MYQIHRVLPVPRKLVRQLRKLVFFPGRQKNPKNVFGYLALTLQHLPELLLKYLDKGNLGIAFGFFQGPHFVTYGEYSPSGSAFLSTWHQLLPAPEVNYRIHRLQPLLLEVEYTSVGLTTVQAVPVPDHYSTHPVGVPGHLMQ